MKWLEYITPELVKPEIMVYVEGEIKQIWKDFKVANNLTKERIRKRKFKIVFDLINSKFIESVVKLVKEVEILGEELHLKLLELGDKNEDKRLSGMEKLKLVSGLLDDTFVFPFPLEFVDIYLFAFIVSGIVFLLNTIWGNGWVSRLTKNLRAI